MLSGPEIQDALRVFVARWGGYTGSERAEAQTFLNQVCECYEMKAPGVPLLNRRIATSEIHDNPFNRADVAL